MAMSKHALVLSFLVVLFDLGSLPTTSCFDDVNTHFNLWVRNQTTNASQDAGCAKKDVALSSAETIKVKHFIDPNSELRPEDGGYTTISESISNIPDSNTKRYVLVLKPGAVFREKLFLSRNKPFVTIMSEDPKNPAVIIWNDTATTLGKDGKPLGTDGSSTVTIESDYFIAYNVVFKNDAPLPKPGEKKGEASALRVLGTKATFYNCTIDGGQGALYDQMGLHYFKACAIKGTVDFIFGAAKSFYEECNIISVAKETADILMAPPEQQRPKNPIMVARGESGFTFKTCTIQGGGQQIYLGRVGTPVIYSYTEISKEIVSIISDGRDVQRAQKGYYCATFKCYGPGMAPMTTSALTYDQAKPFLGTYYISGDSWIQALPPADE